LSLKCSFIVFIIFYSCVVSSDAMSTTFQVDARLVVSRDVMSTNFQVDARLSLNGNESRKITEI